MTGMVACWQNTGLMGATSKLSGVCQYNFMEMTFTEQVRTCLDHASIGTAQRA